MGRPKREAQTGESMPDSLEDILRDIEKKFPFLAKSALDVLTLLDGDGTVRYASLASERFLGYKPDELVGKNVLGIIHPDDAQNVLDAFAGMMRQPGVTEYMQYRIKHKDGSWRWAESVGNNLIHQPFISCLVINSRDITERKLADDALKESEEYYRTLIEHSMDAIVIIDEQATYKYSNLALEGGLGYKQDDLIGKSSLDFTALMTPKGPSATDWRCLYIVRPSFPRTFSAICSRRAVVPRLRIRRNPFRPAHSD